MYNYITSLWCKHVGSWGQKNNQLNSKPINQLNPPPGIAAEDYIEQRTSGLAMEEIPSTLQPFDNQNLLDFNQVEQTQQVLGCFWLAFWGNGYYSPWKSHLANPILVFNHQLLKQSPFQRGSRSQEMSHFLKGNHDFSR